MKNVKSGHTKPMICLDAGHYGKYNRSPIVTNYYESDMTWKLHKYQEEELTKYGITVRLTRSNQDNDMDLVARGKASSGCDLFISNHSNATGATNVDRPEAIYLVDDNCGYADEASRDIATLLVDTIRDVMQTTDKAKVYSRLSSVDRDGDGLHNDDYYGVLYGAHQVGTPAIILEHSFHTNKRAAQWLMDDTNLRRLAKAEAKTIASWFGLNKVTNTVDYAASFNKAKAGTYRVSSSDGMLNMRAGASTQKPIIDVLYSKSLVKCYGYYTGDWLFVVSANGTTGFCHSGYLIRV